MCVYRPDPALSLAGFVTKERERGKEGGETGGNECITCRKAWPPRVPLPLQVTAPDSKRIRTSARQAAANAAHASGMHYVPDRQDPARDAINNSRDKKMHEVLASMLTTLHSEALGKEKRAALSKQLQAWINALCVAHNTALKACADRVEHVRLLTVLRI